MSPAGAGCGIRAPAARMERTSLRGTGALPVSDDEVRSKRLGTPAAGSNREDKSHSSNRRRTADRPNL
jgi:hypothetical protein